MTHGCVTPSARLPQRPPQDEEPWRACEVEDAEEVELDHDVPRGRLDHGRARDAGLGHVVLGLVALDGSHGAQVVEAVRQIHGHRIIDARYRQFDVLVRSKGNRHLHRGSATAASCLVQHGWSVFTP